MSDTPSAPRVLVVSGADERYAHLLDDLIASLRDTGVAGRVDIGVFDLGLAPETRARYEAEGLPVVAPDVELEVPAKYRGGGPYVVLSRLFMPEYFPGYDVYVWMDCDTWVQTADAVDAYVEGASRLGGAVGEERHPTYRFAAKLKGYTLKNLVKCFGAAEGARLFARAHINAGVFAFAADAPHWALWRDILQTAMNRSGRVEATNQMALNYTVYRTAAKTAFLPAHYNWICDKGPLAWDPGRRRYVDTGAEHSEIKVLHLAGVAKKTPMSVRILGGGREDHLLLYSRRPEALAGAA